MTTQPNQPEKTRNSGLEKAIAQFVSSCSIPVNAYQVTQALQGQFTSLDQHRVNLSLMRLAKLQVLAKPLRGYYQAGPALAEYLTTERRRGGRKANPDSRYQRVYQAILQLLAEHELITWYHVREVTSKALGCQLQDKMPEAAIVLQRLVEAEIITREAKGIYKRLRPITPEELAAAQTPDSDPDSFSDSESDSDSFSE